MTLRPINIDFDEDDQDDDEESYLLEVTPKGDPAALEAASEALPRLMLERSMTAPLLATFRHQQGITAIIKAPGAEWVTPLQDAGKAKANWGFCVAASAGRKVKDVKETPMRSPISARPMLLAKGCRGMMQKQ